MWVWIFSCRQFEDTFENTQWRKAMEVQPMWLCVLLFTPFEVAFKITYWWRKDKQKERHLNIHIRGNLHKCNLCDYAATQAVHLKAHLKTHSGEKPYKCTQCIYASANLCNLRKHAQWGRKTEHMQPMQVCLLWTTYADDSYANTQWWQAKQMQPMQLCIPSGRQFEEPFENSQRRKGLQMRQMQL